MLHSLGVIIARFQVPALHPGHLHLIEEIMSRHSYVLLLLGQSRANINDHDPIPYELRRRMVRDQFPSLKLFIEGIMDEPDDRIWSKNVDAIIARYVEQIYGAGHSPGTFGHLYGSRKSFIPHYSGAYRTQEIQTIVTHSGTSIRNNIHPADSIDFRAGMIYSQNIRYPVTYNTVDMAVVKGDEVLLGRKIRDGGAWRFPGGFVNPSDLSLESAAKRELHEELGLIEVGPARYIGSAKIDDWRYRSTKDGVMTKLFRFDFVFGAPTAGDDLDEISWCKITDLEPNVITSHQPLVALLKKDFGNA